MPKPILVLTDGDGTLTNRAGLDTVRSNLYQRMLTGYSEGVFQNYSKTTLKDQETVVALLTAQFGPFSPFLTYTKQDSDMLISESAFDFLSKSLENPAITICIITKNKAAYFEALLEYQKFPKDKLARIFIDDSGLKYKAALHLVYNYEPKYVVILDDNEDDCNEMYRGANKYVTSTSIVKYHQKPKEFEWANYLKSLQQIVDLPSHSKLIEACFFGASPKVATQLATIIDNYCLVSPQIPKMW